MIDKNDYFKSLSETLDNGYVTKSELLAVVNQEPTRNYAALDFREHIAQGLVEMSEARQFLEGLK